MAHKQSGEALNGGFEKSTDDLKKLDKTLLKKSQTEYVIGGGYQFNERTALALRINLGGQVFQNAALNYRNTLLELSFFKSFNLN